MISHSIHCSIRSKFNSFRIHLTQEETLEANVPCIFQELLNKFREKKVDFAAHTNTEDGGAVFLNLLGKAEFSSLDTRQADC